MTVRRAVLIVPPADLMTPVEAIRRRFDTLVDAVPAHVTLVFPFESDISDEALRSHIESATRDFPSFRIELRGFSCVEDQYLFFGVDAGSEEIRDLHRRLYTGSLAPFLSDLPFSPHVTVGRFRTADECTAVVKGLEPKNLRIETLAVAATLYDLDTTPYKAIFDVEWG